MNWAMLPTGVDVIGMRLIFALESFGYGLPFAI